MIYDLNGNQLAYAYGYNGDSISSAFDVDGVMIFPSEEEEWENENQSSTKEWYVSQIGYDVGKSKKATFTNGIRGTAFTLKNSSDDSVVYTGEIVNQMADFSDFDTTGDYYLSCDGIDSYSFKIAPNRIATVCMKNSLDFMAQARQDAWNTHDLTGYAWRDSHQFSFELNGLVMQYMSNPTYYNSLPYGIYKADECEFESLRVQDCPDIIWLMKFAVMRYYTLNTNGTKLHALIKGQVAYFLYLYPHISQYADSTWYQTIRDWIIEQWSVPTCNKYWYEVDGGINHNLFTTQAKIGTVKGNLPPGYAVVPNLMMYKVTQRDGLASASQFMTAAQNNINWLVNSVDLLDPANTKGQRMSEYIPFHALTYAYEMYPNLCPSNTYTKLVAVAKKLISRSANIWDYTKYNDERWVNLETSGGLCNNPGYVLMMGVYYALARVITTPSIRSRLKVLAISHHDHAFGRNPTGRCYSYYATRDFDGAKLGWVSQRGGLGDLNWVTAVLDGSPKEENFPYDPSGSTGYTEGWVAFNSAWNMALAYLNGEKIISGGSYYAIGDSIVYNSGTKATPRTVSGVTLYGYTQAIEDEYGVVCTNRGISNHTIVQDYSTLSAINYSNISLVTIGYGVNDGRLNVTLGTVDSTDTTTFAGALSSLIAKIKGDNPDCIVMVLTPIQRLFVNNWGSFTENANGDTLEDFANMCISVAEKHNTPYVDLFHDSGLAEDNLEDMTFDGVHPNNTGYEMMANTIIPVLSEYITPKGIGIFAKSN